MKLAVSIATPEVKDEPRLALFEGSFEERLAKAKAYGYDGIELVTKAPAALDMIHLECLLKRYRLQAAAVASGCIAATRGLTLLSTEEEKRKAAFALLLELIDMATRLKADVVTIGSFKGKAKLVGGATLAEEMLADIMKRADHIAYNEGVAIAIEPLNPLESDMLCTTEEVAAYIDHMGTRSVKLLMDSYHIFMNSESAECVIPSYIDKIAHVHLADSGRLPVGLGKADFKALEKALFSVGYTGWQSAELARDDEPDKNAEITINNIKKIYTEINE